MAMDISKVECVAKWSAHMSIKEVKGFMGLLRYYFRFVKHFSSLAKPLTIRLKKNAWEQNEKVVEAFLQLKQTLCNAPVLVLPNFQLEFCVDTYAWGYGMGTVLQQRGQPIIFSVKLSG